MCRLVGQCGRFFLLSLVQSAFKLSKTYWSILGNTNINNPLIFLKSASWQRFLVISASPELISISSKIFCSLFNLFSIELSEECHEMIPYCCCEKCTYNSEGEQSNYKVMWNSWMSWNVFVTGNSNYIQSHFSLKLNRIPAQALLSKGT